MAALANDAGMGKCITKFGRKVLTPGMISDGRISACSKTASGACFRGKQHLDAGGDHDPRGCWVTSLLIAPKLAVTVVRARRGAHLLDPRSVRLIESEDFARMRPQRMS